MQLDAVAASAIGTPLIWLQPSAVKHILQIQMQIQIFVFVFMFVFVFVICFIIEAQWESSFSLMQ